MRNGNLCLDIASHQLYQPPLTQSLCVTGASTSCRAGTGNGTDAAVLCLAAWTVGSMFRHAARAVGSVTWKEEQPTWEDYDISDRFWSLLRGNLRELTSTSPACAGAIDKALFRVKAGAGAKAEPTTTQVRGIKSIDWTCNKREAMAWCQIRYNRTAFVTSLPKIVNSNFANRIFRLLPFPHLSMSRSVLPLRGYTYRSHLERWYDPNNSRERLAEHFLPRLKKGGNVDEMTYFIPVQRTADSKHDVFSERSILVTLNSR